MCRKIFWSLLAVAFAALPFNVMGAAADTACTINASSAKVDGSTLWPEVPGGQTATPCDFAQFAWNNFLFYAGNDGSNHPRFMSLTPSTKAMPVSGKPVPTTQYTSLNAAEMRQEKNLEQAGNGFHLLDATGKTVAYEIRVNDVMVNWIADNGMYTTQAIDNAAQKFISNPLTNGIWLPPNGVSQNDSLEIKTSWRNFGSVNGACPSEIMHCEKDDSGNWWGLLGMHFVQKTPNHGEFIWASFEHINNAPDCTTGGSNPIAPNAPVLADRNGKKAKAGTGWNLFDYDTYKAKGGDGKSCGYPGSGITPVLCEENPNPTSNAWVKVNVCRTNKLPPPTDCNNATGLGVISCLNSSVKNSLGSVWKNYELIGEEHVLWGVSALGAPSVGCWNFTDVANQTASLTCVNPKTPEARNMILKGDVYLANSTMETWMQKGINTGAPTSSVTQTDCFGCHQPTTKSYQGNMSHLFDRAMQIGDVEAGPIWNQQDAQMTCPRVCKKAGGMWNGQWNTTVWGQMSVCGCIKNPN